MQLWELRFDLPEKPVRQQQTCAIRSDDDGRTSEPMALASNGNRKKLKAAWRKQRDIRLTPTSRGKRARFRCGSCGGIRHVRAARLSQADRPVMSTSDVAREALRPCDLAATVRCPVHPKGLRFASLRRHRRCNIGRRPSKRVRSQSGTRDRAAYLLAPGYRK